MKSTNAVPLLSNNQTRTVA